MAHRVTLIPGDGTGPELTEATRRVLEATGVEFDWDVQDAGATSWTSTAATRCPTGRSRRSGRAASRSRGRSRLRSAAASARSTSALRKGLDLYAQVRPCKSYPGVRSRYEDVDLVIVRETTEDLYAGIEYEAARDEARELTEWIARTAELPARRRGDLDQADLGRGHAPRLRVRLRLCARASAAAR